MKPHVVRMIEERKALDAKINSLEGFMKSKKWEELSIAQHRRMKKQLILEKKLVKVLNERIEADSNE